MVLAADPHPDEAQLAAFLLGRLDPESQAEVEEHVSQCDACCRVLTGVPDDTLAQSLRASGGAETIAIGATPGVSLAIEPAVSGLPPSLAEHPRYRIIRQLGKGGMGVVYLAEHRLMDRMVALKVINNRLLTSPTALERFRLEVKAAARLTHSAIVTAFDAEQAGDLHFLVTEYVDGVNLFEHVGKRGPLSPALACSMIRQAAQGLQHAADRGMVHRDIKPHNLMVTRKGQVKILDFGLARLAHGGDVDSSGDNSTRGVAAGLTMDGVVLGTPDFIAPEQVSDSRSVDIRADIYSLGCTLYYILTAQTPFAGGSSLEKAMAHLQSRPRPMDSVRDDIPPDLKAIVERMMARNPADRFQTPAEVAQALSPFIKAARAAAEPEQAMPAGSAASAAAPAETASQPLDALLASYPLPGQSPQQAYGFSHPVAGADPFGWPSAPRRQSSGWPRAIKRHRMTIAAVGGATVGLIVVGFLLSSLLGRLSDPIGPGPLAKQEGARQGDQIPPLGSAPSEMAGMGAFAAPTGDRPNVLLVIPHNGFWWGDFEPVQRKLAGMGANVVIASSRSGRAEPLDYDHNPRPVKAELSLDAVDPTGFDAVVFVGGNVQEFIGGAPAATDAKRIIQAMLASDRKPWVTSLCKGTAVLFDAGALRDRDAACNVNIQKLAEKSSGVRWDWNNPVVVSDNIVTGSDYQHAEEFADKLVELLSAGQ